MFLPLIVKKKQKSDTNFVIFIFDSIRERIQQINKILKYKKINTKINN